MGIDGWAEEELALDRGRARRAAAGLPSCSRHGYLVGNIAPSKRGYHDAIPASPSRAGTRSLGSSASGMTNGTPARPAAITGRAEVPGPAGGLEGTAIPSIRHSCLHDHTGISWPSRVARPGMRGWRVSSQKPIGDCTLTTSEHGVLPRRQHRRTLPSELATVSI